MSVFSARIAVKNWSEVVKKVVRFLRAPYFIGFIRGSTPLTSTI